MTTAPMWTATAHPAVSATFVPARPARSRTTVLCDAARHVLVGAVAVTLLVLALGPHTAAADAATLETVATAATLGTGFASVTTERSAVATRTAVRTDVTTRAVRGAARSGAPAAIGQAARTSVSRAVRSATPAPMPLTAHRAVVTPAVPMSR